MISWVVIDRVVESERAKDAGYRERTASRPLRSSGRRLSDDQLVEKLHSLGLEVDRRALERLCDEYLSAEEIAGALIERYIAKSNARGFDSDWIWICLTTLWERWFPHKPSFEMLDDKMQTGYEMRKSEGSAAACRIWLEAWDDVKQIIDKADIQSVEEFDRLFRGTEAVFNWVQDLEDELAVAGVAEPGFLMERIAVCEYGLSRLGSVDDLTAQNRRRALAESHFALGEVDEADALFQEWLDADPRWGWGWIGWSDCYRLARGELVDLNRAEALLREGLAVPEVNDDQYLVERLVELLAEQGRVEEAADVSARCSSKPTAHTKGLVDRKKVGRNDPCPCGSGKKFKKCCG